MTEISDSVIGAFAVTGTFGIILTGIVAGTIKSTCRNRAREQTKREIAAYVAEGSISPDDAERILKADMPVWERGAAAMKCRCGR
jgi:hypothetical protein